MDFGNYPVCEAANSEAALVHGVGFVLRRYVTVFVQCGIDISVCTERRQPQVDEGFVAVDKHGLDLLVVIREPLGTRPLGLPLQFFIDGVRRRQIEPGLFDKLVLLSLGTHRRPPVIPSDALKTSARTSAFLGAYTIVARTGCSRC